MKRALVVGRLWASLKASGLAGRKLLLLAPLGADGRPTGGLLVAADGVSCVEGDEVLVSFGSGARNAVSDDDAPLEACVVGLVAKESRCSSGRS